MGREKKGIPPAFEHVLREWGRRDPRTSPEIAAARLRARLGQRARKRLVAPPLAAWATATAAAGLIATFALLWIGSGDRGEPEPVPSSPPPAAAAATPPLGENVVLWWLDPETPVYFVLNPPET